MQSPLDCQRLLAERLKKTWVSQAVDRAQLSKSLRLSERQISALESGQDDAFHTRGLYIRALEQALQEAGLQDDAEASECLACLLQHYAQTPRGSQIALVQQAVNKRLGVAPKDPTDRPPARFGLFGVAMIIAVLVAIVIGVSVLAK
jgi:hypothetical protein